MNFSSKDYKFELALLIQLRISKYYAINIVLREMDFLCILKIYLIIIRLQ